MKVKYVYSYVIMSSGKYLQCYLQTCFFPTRLLKQRPSQNACNTRLRMPAGDVLLQPRLRGWW